MHRVVIVALAVLVSASAHAEPEFPAAIKDAAQVPCEPPCTLCHTISPGTRETATKPFAFTVLRNGLKAKHPESLVAVVAKLRSDQVDTDGDGVIDVDELAAGTDPSSARAGAELCGPLYGCAGGHIAKVPPRGADRAPWLLAAALALVLFSRVRRPRSGTLLSRAGTGTGTGA